MSDGQDDLLIFQRELQGLDLDSTFDALPNAHLVPDSPDNNDPHTTFVQSQQRYIVEKLLESTEKSARYEMKTEDSTCVAVLELHDVWSRDTKLEKGMLINIVDVESKMVGSHNTFIVNRDGGFVVVEPDILVSITSITSQLWCKRKSALSEFFKFPFNSEIMLRGTIAHDLIGRAMVDKITDKAQLQEMVKQCLLSPSIMNTAYSCKMSHQETLKMATELIPFVQEFIRGRILQQAKDQNVTISSVCDIEDSYWNPIFGLKGKLDATVCIHDKNGEESIVPLEFKIGNETRKGRRVTNNDHMGQVSLYTLLMRPRYGVTNGGLLLYIREDFLKECTVQLGELQSLIIMRNNLAQSTVSVKGVLSNIPRPGSIEFERICDKCELKTVCGLMLRDRPSALSNLYTDTERKISESIDHLHHTEIDFFSRWMKIITLEIEEHERTANSKTLWTTKAEVREKHGQCLSNLEFVHISPIELMDTGGNRYYKLTLKKADGKSMTKTSLTEQDMVTLSTQDELCISYAFIETINDQHLTLSIERKLNERSSRPHTRFIVDKVISNKVLKMQYGNLSLLMGPTPEAQRLRSYIIGNQWSPIKTKPVFSTLTISKIKQYQPFLFEYNDDQRRAILTAIATDSFLFIKGMPGTGKTKTVVGLLRLLSHENQRVLVVTYTNNALDNILLKYKEYNKDFLRVGTPSKLNPEALEEFSTDWMVKTSSNIDQLTTMYNNKRIVGSTLMRLQHEIFSVRKTFDYCIIDEASQALPTCVFGALMFAKKYILLGDPDQLPAIIKSTAVQKMRVEDSMFSLISQPFNTVNLSMQYRMNSAIMNLANRLVYNDTMKCANEETKDSYIDIPTKRLKEHIHSVRNHKTQKWLASVLSKKLAKSVVFLDTSTWNAPEEKIGESVKNIHEANIVRTCVESFITCGYSGGRIGIIAPFRGQVAYIRQIFQGLGIKFKYVEVNTVDQYQGRDKDIIICSFTKSKNTTLTNYNVVGGEELKASILQDIRRLNVAITRAKSKLIMVGNRNTLDQFEPFRKLFPLLTNEQVISITDS